MSSAAMPDAVQKLRDEMRVAMYQLNKDGMPWTQIYLSSLSFTVDFQYQNLFELHLEPGESTHEGILRKLAITDATQATTGWMSE